MAGKFEIYKGGGKTGGYRWRLKSRNGEIVASGEAYETKAGAKKGVDAVQRAAAGDIRKWQGEMVGVDFDRLLGCVNEPRDYLAEASGYNPGILD